MAVLLRIVLKSLNIFNFLSFYPILIKLISKCIMCQDLSSKIHSLETLHFPLSTVIIWRIDWLNCNSYFVNLHVSLID